MFQTRCYFGLIVNFLNLCLLSPEPNCEESTSVPKAKLRATSSTSGKSDFLSPKTNLLPVDALRGNVTEISQWNLSCLKLWCKLTTSIGSESWRLVRNNNAFETSAGPQLGENRQCECCSLRRLRDASDRRQRVTFVICASSGNICILRVGE